MQKMHFCAPLSVKSASFISFYLCSTSISSNFPVTSLLRAKIEEEHSKQYQEKIDKLSLEVLLVEDGGSEEEADDDTASAHHAYDTDHRTWQTQRIEIYEVGCTEEDADEDDGPMPAE